MFGQTVPSASSSNRGGPIANGMTTVYDGHSTMPKRIVNCTLAGQNSYQRIGPMETNQEGSWTN